MVISPITRITIDKDDRVASGIVVPKNGVGAFIGDPGLAIGLTPNSNYDLFSFETESIPST